MNTGCWEQRTTRGTPPLGVAGYSCVAVRNELHYFGGGCGHSGCHHNCVHTLSTSTLQWRMLAPSTTEGGAPIQKRWCGMVHFTDGEEDLLYVVGGWSCCPIITTTWSTVSTSTVLIVCVPMNNTFSLCPQVSDTVLSQYSPPSSE